ncbi:20592_t:CDS:10 [Dentiscutata erythropus]|uniref:20592_t:CDS:1 n=1 Tax=Dentiscutata erythropus TaxID=1348616 RepID=A0A9N9DEA4_9GLOM|nr:20592_t:CDS:10 [Dentiscutata erythropus]
MKFGKYLLQSQIPEWSGDLVTNLQRNGVFNDEEFPSALDCELNKANECFVHQENIFRELSEKYPNLLSSELLSDLSETKNKINNLLSFADLNIKACNKILKKYDKKLKRNIRDDYLNTKVNTLPLASSSTLINILGSIEQWIHEINEVEHQVVDNENVTHNSSDLFDAIRNDDESAFRELIIRETNGAFSDNRIINQANPIVRKTLKSMLYKACCHPAFECIKLLLESGANIHDEEDINERSLIHKLVIHGGILPKGNVTTPPISSSISSSVSSPILIPDDPRIIACILDHHPSDSQALSLDVYGKSPLHYAAIKGLVQITQTLLEFLKRTGQFSLEAGFNDRVWFDGDGYSPLFYATLKNNVQLVDCIIRIGQITGERLDAVSNVPNSTTAQTLLAMSCKLGYDSMVDLLLNHGANPDVQDKDGETPLHQASRCGSSECCLLLIDKDANKEIREKYNGWTPLFLAVIEGHKETVTVLRESAANINIVDNSGWTPHMHAVFHGHFKMIDILRPPRETILSSFSADHNIMVSSQDNIAERKYLQDQSLIFVTLGTTDARINIAPIELYNTIKTPVSIVIWAKNATGEKVTIDLPVRDSSTIDDNFTIDPMMFYAHDINNVRLMFDIISTYDAQLIGRAIAMLSSVKTYFGPNYSSLMGSVTIPIIGVSEMDDIGQIRFESSVVKPFNHRNLADRNRFTSWESSNTKLIGHRGMGANDKTLRLQVGENTVESFRAAALIGAEYIEFDCQLTKDLKPVIYHDWNVTETGCDIPIHSINSDQFIKLKKKERDNSVINFREENSMTPPNSEGDIDSTPNSSSFRRLQRSSSMSSLNKIKYRRTDENNQGKMKGNGIGTIQSREIPTELGFNIEVKYPVINEAEDSKLPAYCTELNTFCDKILKCVYNYAQPGRKIIFSSFHPEICLMLRYKQSSYPVFFLTDCGVSFMADARCNSIQAAIRFAKIAGLSGLVTNSDPIVEAPGLVKVIKNAGLLLFTYGRKNNDPENVKLQTRAGVNAVIADLAELKRQNRGREPSIWTLDLFVDYSL